MSDCYFIPPKLSAFVRSISSNASKGLHKFSTAIAEDAEEHPLRDYVVGLGLPALLWGAGFTMMGSSDQFWVGFWIVISACSGLALIWWLLSGKSKLIKRLPGLFISAIAAGPVLWLAFRPAPLNFDFIATKAHYVPGVDHFGIKWIPEYSEAIAIISNNTNIDYHNVDIWIRTDIAIVHAEADSDADDCKASIENPWFDVAAMDFMYKSKKTGNKFSVPTSPYASTFWRIRCVDIVPNSEVRIHLALVYWGNDNIHAGYRDPTWAYISTKYDAGNRPESAFKSKCITAGCGGLPKSFGMCPPPVIVYWDEVTKTFFWGRPRVSC